MNGVTEPLVATVHWRTGLIGCMLPVLVATCALFGFAAFDPSLVDELARERRGWLIGLSRAVTVGGVNVPMLLLASYLGWEVFRFAWRWADETAAGASSSHLIPHRSTLLKPIAWSEIAEVAFLDVGRSPSLVITLRNGATRKIAGIDNSDGAAESFAASARHLAARHQLQPIP